MMVLSLNKYHRGKKLVEIPTMGHRFNSWHICYAKTVKANPEWKRKTNVL
jgi:hypothetical protein